MTLMLRQYVRASRLELQAENPRTFSVTYDSQFSIGKLQADLLLKSNAQSLTTITPTLRTVPSPQTEKRK